MYILKEHCPSKTIWSIFEVVGTSSGLLWNSIFSTLKCLKNPIFGTVWTGIWVGDGGNQSLTSAWDRIGAHSYSWTWSRARSWLSCVLLQRYWLHWRERYFNFSSLLGMWGKHHRKCSPVRSQRYQRSQRCQWSQWFQCHWNHWQRDMILHTQN